ncbi:hypothetical protein, partial [Rhodopirellula sallentina]|uniref:hypothetical protein n=1 Tax=Rhodopirellula sallentina TaxID=1263869 RepID=UPI0005C7C488
MSIEKRRGTSRQYRYKPRRVAGTLQNSYVGPATDPLVELFAIASELSRSSQRDLRLQLQRERQEFTELEVSLKRIAGWASSWKVFCQLNELSETRVVKMDSSERDAFEIPGIHEFRRIRAKAREGDKAANDQLDKWIDRFPVSRIAAFDLVDVARSQL